MDREQSGAESLATFYHVVDISFRIMLAGIAVAVVLYRGEIIGKTSVFKVDAFFVRGKGGVGARV